MFEFNGMKYVDATNYVILWRLELEMHPFSYCWEKDSGWRRARDG